MPKSKEFSKPHVAMQTEETPLIVSQISKEHVGAAIDKLNDMAIAKRPRRNSFGALSTTGPTTGNPRLYRQPDGAGQSQGTSTNQG